MKEKKCKVSFFWDPSEDMSLYRSIYYYIYTYSLRCGCQMFLKCIYGSNLLLLFDVCASKLRVRFLDEWFDWLPIYIINQSTWLFFYHMIYFCAFFCMSSKLKALHCWNILLPFWFKGWPWCVYCYLHLEISCLFGLAVSPDSGLPTAYLWQRK